MRLSLLVCLIPLLAYVKADSAVRQVNTPVPYVPLTRSIIQSITCSKSVANACAAAGRRKRDILTETDIYEQFAPSAVRNVERTTTTVTQDHLREISDASGFLIGEQRSAAEELDSTIHIDAQERAGVQVTYAVGNIGVFLAVSLSVITVTPACSAPGTMFQCPLL